MSNIYKLGIVTTEKFIEPGGVTNQFIGNSSYSYTPGTGTNSCLSTGKWMVPEGTSAGDKFQVRLLAMYNGFDSSNTAGTFTIRFQGANYTSPTTSAWQGTNPVTSALNSFRSLTTTVLSGTSGSYMYITYFSLGQDWLNTYYGSNIGIRSDYSNGTGKLTIRDITIIPAKYSTSDIQPKTAMRFSNPYVTVTEFIEM